HSRVHSRMQTDALNLELHLIPQILGKSSPDPSQHPGCDNDRRDNDLRDFHGVRPPDGLWSLCHSITRSARSITDGGNSRPSDLAVLRLMMNSIRSGSSI